MKAIEQTYLKHGTWMIYPNVKLILGSQDSNFNQKSPHLLKKHMGTEGPFPNPHLQHWGHFAGFKGLNCWNLNFGFRKGLDRQFFENMAIAEQHLTI